MSSRLFKLTFASMCLFVAAASATTESKSASQGRIAITGCLQAGKTRDRFTLNGAQGKTYALRSTSINLAEHVGHTVSIRGQVKHDQKRDDYDFEGSEVNEEYGKGKVVDPIDVEVASLKVVAASCR